MSESEELVCEIDGWGSALIKEGEASGLKWRIHVHQEFETFNGYVGVPVGHPAFMVFYDDIDADVHGGLTFAGMKGDRWWFGFDTAHYCDFVPGIYKTLRRIGGDPDKLFEGTKFRTQAYVEAECVSLAAQLALMKALR